MPLRVCHVIAAFVVAATSVPCGVFAALHHAAPSALFVGLAFFCGLNALICFWELALAYRIRRIERDFRQLRERVAPTPRGRLSELAALFTARVAPVSQVVSLDLWCRIWSTYALYDPAYANHESFGFWIDVANGHATLVPSALWVVGTTVEVLPARALGLVSLVAFYQELYGTLIYFAQFVYHRRYRGKSGLEIALFVGLSNGIWIVGPLVGLYASVVLIYDGDFRLFHPPH